MADVVRREEELREALLDLERAWTHEHELRQQYQGLLQSLSNVSSITDRKACLSEVVHGVRDMLGAQDVYALEPEGDAMVVTSATRDDALGTRWRRRGVLLRAIEGPPKMVFDALHLPEAEAQQFACMVPARSLLLGNLSRTAVPLLLICTHRDPAFFTSSQCELLMALAPFVQHALLNIDAQGLERERRWALQKAAVLEHATNAMGVGLARLNTDDELVYASHKLETLVADFGEVKAWFGAAMSRVNLPAPGRCAACGSKHRRGVVAVQLDTPDGETRHFELHWVGQAHRTSDDSEVLLVGDATTEKRSQAALEHSAAQLRQAQKLEAVGRLAGGVAHDFNNTLGIILGSAELALRKLHDPEYLRMLLEQVRDATRDGAALVNQLLAFSRRQVQKPSIVDLNDVVSRTTDMLGRLMPGQVTLEVDHADNLGIVRADPGQLSQVVLNLALNARDAAGATGNITIRTANVVIDDAHHRLYPDTPLGRYVMLMVVDDGPGISERDLPHIFDPFFSTKQGEESTGLGLASVYGIVKQSGAAIEVDTSPGVGTTFRVYLPRIDGTIPPPEPRLRASSGPPSDALVLLVEDNDALRDVTATSLETFGFEVLVASTPDEALTIAQEHRAGLDLLITDVRLQNSLGTDLARHLCEVKPTLKVLYISPFPPSRGSAEARADNLLVKPFTADELVQRVRRTLAH